MISAITRSFELAEEGNIKSEEDEVKDVNGSTLVKGRGSTVIRKTTTTTTTTTDDEDDSDDSDDSEE